MTMTIDGERPGGLNLTQRTTGNQRMLGMGETVLLRKRIPIGYPIPKPMMSPEKLYTNNTIQTEQVMFSNIYVYTYAYNNN